MSEMLGLDHTKFTPKIFCRYYEKCNHIVMTSDYIKLLAEQIAKVGEFTAPWGCDEPMTMRFGQTPDLFLGGEECPLCRHGDTKVIDMAYWRAEKDRL